MEGLPLHQLHFVDDRGNRHSVQIIAHHTYRPIPVAGDFGALVPRQAAAATELVATVSTTYTAKVGYEGLAEELKGETPEAVRDALERWLAKLNAPMSPRAVLDFIEAQVRRYFGPHEVTFSRLRFDGLAVSSARTGEEFVRVFGGPPGPAFGTWRAARAVLRVLFTELR